MSEVTLLTGEPLRLTAAEWARVPQIEAPSGPYETGFAVGEAAHDRDPAAPLMAHDEYLAETAQ